MNNEDIHAAFRSEFASRQWFGIGRGASDLLLDLAHNYSEKNKLILDYVDSKVYT